MDLFRFIAGDKPLLISVPHAGSYIPDDIAARMTKAGGSSADTDWNVDRLYNFAVEAGYSMLIATHSRYVVDLNRSAGGEALYPGEDETGLCPTTNFAEDPLYMEGDMPDEQETASRITKFWQPYHEQLAASLSAMKEKHGRAHLWEAHSIKSFVPRFFEGRLSDLNFGTNNGKSTSDARGQRLLKMAQDHGQFSCVLNDRFKGGYITRHYGDPEQGTEAVQLEISQIIYMDEEPPFAFDEARAATVTPLLKDLLGEMCREDE
jgi:N-formylglutamate deformylase